MDESEYDKYVALDCEITTTIGGKKEPTQVAITDINGNKLFNEYFNLKNNPLVPMTKKRAEKLKKMAKRTYDIEAREDVLSNLRGKIVIGHDLKHDFNALNIDPAKDGLAGVLDSSILPLFKQNNATLFPSRGLKNLAEDFLQRRIQRDALHDALEDAKASANIIRKTFPYLNAPFPITHKTVAASKVIKNYGRRMGIKEALPTFNPQAAEFVPMAAQPINFLRFEPIKSAENYSKEMEGLNVKKSMAMYLSEMDGLNMRRTYKNYLREMEGLNMRKTAKNYLREMEGLNMSKSINHFANLVKGGNKTRRRKTRRLRRTYRRF